MASTALRPGRSVVVTNAGAGLGRAVALGLAAKGYIVFGTAVSAAEVSDLKAASGGRVSLAVCDMTKAMSVQAWAGGVTDALGSTGLQLLINNARFLMHGPVELLQLDAIRHEFECNVFGAISVTNAFLPALRMARGRVVQISSWMANLPLPFSGPSEASHAAIEVFSAVYRAELKLFGIEVVVACVGDVTTSGPAKAAALAQIAHAMTSGQRRIYGKTLGTAAATLSTLTTTDITLAAAAARVVDIAEQHPAPSRIAVGRTAERMLRAAREKPDAELDALRLSLVGLS